MWLNFKRKSTAGFHIGGVLVDFGGGVLSLLQMDVYCFIEHSNNQLTGNIPKMALAVVTLLFNIILVWQHYVFYSGNEHDHREKEPLLNVSSWEVKQNDRPCGLVLVQGLKNCYYTVLVSKKEQSSFLIRYRRMNQLGKKNSKKQFYKDANYLHINTKILVLTNLFTNTNTMLFIHFVLLSNN